MAKIDNNLFDLGYIDTLSRGNTYLHKIDPRAKLITSFVFIVMVVSYKKYEVSALIPYFFYPVILCASGNIPFWFIAKKILLVSPFALMIGILNPFLDQEIILRFVGINISGGWISFASIMLRFTLTVSTALILIASTGFNAVCLSLEKFMVPKVFTIQLMFLYRYIFVLVDEASRMVRARALRTFGTSGAGFKSFGPLVGHLLLRTLDRAQRIHLAMCCRGFDGTIRISRPLSIGHKDILFVSVWVLLFISMRLFNLPKLMGLIFLEIF